MFNFQIRVKTIETLDRYDGLSKKSYSQLPRDETFQRRSEIIATFEPLCLTRTRKLYRHEALYKLTVAHICKHNKQFLKHKTMFRKHNTMFLKHNTIFLKHKTKL